MKLIRTLGLALTVGVLALSATAGIASAGTLVTNKNCGTVSGGAFCTGTGYTSYPAVQVYSRFTTTNGSGVFHCAAFAQYNFANLQGCSSGQYAYSRCITPSTTIQPKGQNGSRSGHLFTIQLYRGSSGQTGC